MQQLYAAQRLLADRMLDDWRRTRFISYTCAKYSGMQTLKAGISIERFLPLKGDKTQSNELQEMRKLTKEELIDRYKRSGIKLQDWQIDKIWKK